MNQHVDIRPSPIAGQWYPSDPKRLADSVDQYIQNAETHSLPGQIIAVVTPHAGHLYSGPVAGYAFAQLKGLHPELVAVVSPMHYPYLQPLLTTGHAAYHTPLGDIPVDTGAISQLDAFLRQSLGFGLSRIRNDPEHSLEIELPFLQRSLGDSFKLLPVMLRDQTPPVVEALGHALAHVLMEKNALLVASTDLSHFYTQEEANLLDEEMLRRVGNFDPASVLRAEDEEVGFACGKGALAAVLWAARDLGGTRVDVLKHATSGDVTGDFIQVVGYGAAVVTRPGQEQKG